MPIELSQTRENWRYLTRRKPFDVLAEGLISKNNRGDWTALELFVSAVQAWPGAIRRLLAAA